MVFFLSFLVLTTIVLPVVIVAPRQSCSPSFQMPDRAQVHRQFFLELKTLH